MRGRHSVRVFRIQNDKEFDMPEGWKPFGVADSSRLFTWVVARKWERSE